MTKLNTRKQMTATASPVKQTEDYQWFKYNRVKDTPLVSKKGQALRLKKGSRFGLRPASTSTAWRLVSEELGLTKVFSIPAGLAEALRKQSIKQAQDDIWNDEMDIDLEAISRETKTAELVELHAQKMATIKWRFDYNLLAWLREFEQVSKIYEGNKKSKANPDKALDLAIALLAKKQPPAKNIKMKTKSRGAIAAANAILKGSVPELFDDASSWMEPEGAELDMVCLHITDCADHLELAIKLREGNWKEAEEASHMDTASRELIPDVAWDYIQENLR